MTTEQIRAVQQAAATPAQRLAIALAAVPAARPEAIRELTLEDIDLPSRPISIAGHSQPLGELTRNALLAWLDYRRATWPDTANRHVLITRKSALGTGPVSASYLADYLGRPIGPHLPFSTGPPAPVVEFHPAAGWVYYSANQAVPNHRGRHGIDTKNTRHR